MQGEQSNNLSLSSNEELSGSTRPLVNVPIDVESEEEDFINVPNYQDVNPIRIEQKEPNVSAPRTKKRTSDVWNSFELVKVKGAMIAKCKACKKNLSYNERNGISHLGKHARNTCPMRFLTIDGSQKKLRTITEVDGTSTLELKEKYKEFDQDYTRSILSKMVVVHEYPLSMVNHHVFREYSTSLNPYYKMISRNTLKKDILKLYDADKLSLMRLLEFNDSRIAVTTDMWTSIQKKGFMVVTSHFIDRNWNLRNRTLRFRYSPSPHTKDVLAEVLMECLSQYGLESKISSVVVDNCTTNDAMMRILLANFEKKCLMLKGKFLHLRCSAHILNLIVRDGLEVIESVITKVRECVSFWGATPKRIEKFDESYRFLGISNNQKLILDCKTRWNSTFAMLESALPYVDVFERLKRLNRKLKFDIPSNEDWNLASIICKKLEIFSNATKVFSGKHYPTSNLFFRKACEIKLALRSWLIDDALIVRTMATNMVVKFDKYWDHINILLAIAAILDPRNKMDCVEYYFKKLYGESSEEKVIMVRKSLDDLVIEYQHRNEENVTQDLSKGIGKRALDISSMEGEEDGFAREKKTKKRKVNVMGEVDHYLEDETQPENVNFDILSWWKMDHKYPTLRKIAKDILAIPISSVASESAFSMGGRVISSHRSKLHANTIEVLMCLQNWKVEDNQDNQEDKSACSTINEDSDSEGEDIDAIDMDIDAISYEDMGEETQEPSSVDY